MYRWHSMEAGGRNGWNMEEEEKLWSLHVEKWWKMVEDSLRWWRMVEDGGNGGR